MQKRSSKLQLFFNFLRHLHLSKVHLHLRRTSQVHHFLKITLHLFFYSHQSQRLTFPCNQQRLPLYLQHRLFLHSSKVLYHPAMFLRRPHRHLCLRF